MFARLALFLCAVVLFQPALCLAHRADVIAPAATPLPEVEPGVFGEDGVCGKSCCGIRFHTVPADQAPLLYAAPTPCLGLPPLYDTSPTVWPPLPTPCSSPPLVGFVVLLI